MAETQVKLTRYGLHDHPLVLQERVETMAECKVCQKPSLGPVFTCVRGEKCNFYAHKSCIWYRDVIETPFHPHPLKKHYLLFTRKSSLPRGIPVTYKTLSLFTCRACLKRQAGDCYRCPHTRCSLVLDLECALQVPATLPGLDGHEQIHHPDHLHPLSFCEKINGEVEGTICRVCENKNDSLGPGYGCPECRFFVHNTCRELPKEMQHPSHPFHALKRYPFTEFVCHRCLRDCNSFPYECSKCDFRIDVRCAFFTALTEFKSLEPMRLEFHQHPLLLHEMKDHYGLDCKACEECCTGPMYTCLVCGFFLHKSCALLPKIIGHPSHPDHPLRHSGERQFKCSNCLIDRNSIHYYCQDCDFYLDSGCTFQYKWRQLVHHEIHFDLLEVFEKEDDNVNELECTVCHEPCSGTTYGCRICGFHLHKQCADIQEIQHPAHPFHPLKRAYPCDFKCHACLKDCHGMVSYYCEHCDFYIEIVCAFLEPPIEYKHQQYILHEMHKHPLTLSEKKDGDERVACAACRRRCSGPTFECRVCDFIVHKSCTVLPETVTHPFHQTDLLQMVKTITNFTCSVCIKDYNGLYYTCPGSSCSCSFKVDITCALAEHSLIAYQGHSHPLIFLKDIGDNKSVMCTECCEPCASLVFQFHCPTCDFNLDLLCGPLPCALQHKYHHHVLTLRDTYNVESQECYCDSCEEPRDPMTRVYYCPDCPYHAEINCVMPELIPALTGKLGDVELRISGRWAYHGKMISKASTWKEMQHSNVEQKRDSSLEAEMDMKEIIQSLTKDERDKLENILASSIELFGDLNGEDNNSVEAPDDWPYSDQAFTQLVQGLVSSDSMRLRQCWEAEMKFVRVRDCMVPENLVPVFNDLYRKHGDVSAGLPLSQGMKALLFFYLCQAIESMCRTAVIDVTEDALMDWWSSLRAVRQAGLRVQFAVDVLKRVVLAYFGLRATKFEEDTLADFDQQTELLVENIKEKNTELEEIVGKKEKHMDYVDSGLSSLIDYSLKEASLLKYKNAGDVVLGYHPS